MALALDGTPQNGTATGALAVANTTAFSSLTAGSIILAFVHAEWLSGTPPTVNNVSGGGLTWNRRAAGSEASGFNRYELWWAYAPGVLTSQTITATFNNTAGNFDDATIIVLAVKGFVGTAYQTNPWDANVSLPKVAGIAGSVASLTGISTNDANTFAINFYGGPDGNVAFGTPPAGFTTDPTLEAYNAGGSNYSIQVGSYQVLTSQLSNVTLAWTGSASSSLVNIVDALTMNGTSSASPIVETKQSKILFTPVSRKEFGPGRGLRATQAFPPGLNTYAITVNIDAVSSTSVLKTATKNIAINATSTLTLLRAKAVNIAINVASTVSNLKAVTQNIAINATSTVSNLKATTKNVLATCTSTVTNALGLVTLAIPQVLRQGFLFHPGKGPMWNSRARWAFPPMPTSTNVYQIAVNITSSTTVSVIKSTTKNILATCTSLVTNSKLVTQIIAITSTTTTSVVKGVTKRISISATTTISVFRTATKNILINASSVVSNLKTVTQIITITATSTSSFLRTKAHNIVIACTSTLTLSSIKGALVVISISVSTTMSNLKKVTKSVMINSTTLSTSTKSTTKNILATCSSVVSNIKQVTKKIAINSTTTTTFASVRSRLVNIAITVNSTMMSIKSTSKSILIPVTSTVSALKNTTKKITIACSSVLSILYQTSAATFQKSLRRFKIFGRNTIFKVFGRK